MNNWSVAAVSAAAGGVAVYCFLKSARFQDRPCADKAPEAPAKAPCCKKPCITYKRGDGDDRAEFLKVFEILKADIVEEVKTSYPDLPGDVAEYFDRMMEYNTPHGKLNRGLTVAQGLKCLKDTPLTAEEEFKAAALGWCVEWLQAFFLVADDIMDASETRRGQPCWYKLEDVGLNAINDSIILEAHIYIILKKYFSADDNYLRLIELFQEVTFQTEIGQYMDLTSAQPNKVNFDRYTIQRWQKIVKYKTAFYSFYLPVATAMELAGYEDRDKYDKARSICLEMGEYFQAQDDYLDCYGAPEVIGKIGTDIQDNKCSWLCVHALQIATPEERKLLEENYAQWDDAKVAKVKALFTKLKLPELWTKYEEESYAKLQTLISQMEGMPTTIFDDFVKKIYKRSK